MNSALCLSGGRKIFLTAFAMAALAVGIIAGLTPSNADTDPVATNARAEVATVAPATTADGQPIRVILALR
ncbi:hypothetical protein [Methylobrevis albus]|uniref:Uncharacterized protein n=1 Tax=Methylobrevis albus TaxID=2793297 RepID=A0A931MX62_9HYPH|nr:hypothetical protein [Methylobrevis albus]MBH0238523.1 hypothetical protein [Methylobrevis albus]